MKFDLYAAPTEHPFCSRHLAEYSNGGDFSGGRKMNLEKSSTGITPDSCAAAVVEIIPLIVGSLRAQMRNQGEPFLSISQFRSLMFLYRYPGSSLSKLADYLGVTRPTASAICERLVQEKFVDRKEHPQERRAVVLKLTETGRGRLEEIQALTCSNISPMFEDLSQEQMESVLAGLTLLREVFDGKSNNQ
ncbi:MULTISPECIES: MarR family winged helix-turn-helix transcriptional regulator [unclassified Microcoleus]|uniref:MarR family winged helix-turn-helix transcriptional regulator n=2 Tax=unclassified Microcoleus TaxID=2642155 RepID=UPI0025ECA110|nr:MULTISPECIES: MarR family winged helix-turn-helix transcriptional regulator [unclassified Microcoleus]